MYKIVQQAGKKVITFSNKRAYDLLATTISAAVGGMVAKALFKEINTPLVAGAALISGLAGYGVGGPFFLYTR